MMPFPNLLASAVIALATSAFLTAPAPAHAQDAPYRGYPYPCPEGPGPGEYEAGMTPIDTAGTMVRACLPEEPTPEAPPVDPMIGMMTNLNAGLSTLSEMQAAMIEALNSPANTRLRNGYWSQYQDGEPPAPGQKCGATFANTEGLLGVVSSGGGADPAVLLVSGEDVPRSRQRVMITATLHQTGERPARVQAFNWMDPGSGLGSIAFAMPTLDAAIEGMADQAEVAVEVDGRRVYRLTYHSGKEASAALARCARGSN